VHRTPEPENARGDGDYKIGYRETKLLPKGASLFFFYSFHLIGPTPWLVKHGNVQGAGLKGKFDVKLQKGFSGGELDG
jgi:hypothetical protein